ncbi:CARDB domain-containing protein [Archangium sp. Cb G35]|uniref:CARDB domain-containing protein n=1 Tax=Archangium sp. Cb G35 TaxID=1920190 RepID=UPI0013012CAC|nr:CARDB domain-containing protein [Archangium sp. Cb G35]
MSLFLSADPVITSDEPLTPASDLRLEQVYLPGLAPGQCKTETVNGRASVTIQGTYFLGAIAEPGSFDPNTANNVKTGNAMGIGNRPDFVVASVSGPTSAMNGQSFPATVTVCNPGTAPGAPNVELYLSADTVVTPASPLTPASDRLLGTRSMNTLEPGQCQTETLNVSASVLRDGAYYLSAIVDPARNVSELIEDNNTLAATRIGVGAAPDFVVTSVTGPASVLPGQPLTASVQVCNQGTQPGAAPVHLYLTADDIVTPRVPPNPLTDVLLGEQSSGQLEPGSCRTLSFTGTPAGVAAGAYALGAIVNPFREPSELILDNNTKLSPRFGIGTGPDLIVSSVSGPTGVAPEAPLTAAVRICNQGTASAGATGVELFLVSPLATRIPMGTASVNGLAPNACQTTSITGMSPPPLYEGTYTLGARVDPALAVAELVEDNNAGTGNHVGVGWRPDFVITSVTGPASIQPDQPLSANIEVCNRGTLADRAYVDLYVSSDAIITPQVPPQASSDVFVNHALTNILAPDECQTLSIEGSTYGVMEGANYLGAAVDVANHLPEFFEDNNVHTGSRLGVGNRPDFVVASVTGPTSARPGAFITATLEVCNQGTQPGSTMVELFLSQDTVITPPTAPGVPSDRPAGLTFIDNLAPGQCQTSSVEVDTWPAEPGDYYLGAIADFPNGIPELIEDNNSRTGTRISFTY